MITIKKADVKIFTEKGIEGQICWIAFKRELQDFDTLKILGRAKACIGNVIVMQSMQYKGIQLYPE